MSISALSILGMTVVLAAMLASLTLAAGYSFAFAIIAYAMGGSMFLLTIAFAATMQGKVGSDC